MPNISDQPSPTDFTGGNAIDNTISCTNAVQSAGYNFNLTPGGYIAGNPEVVSGGTDPTVLMPGPLAIINNPQSGGGKRKKKSRKLKRSNKSRLNSKSKKSRSKSVRKSKKVRKTLSKRRVSLKRKSNKKRSKKSLK